MHRPDHPDKAVAVKLEQTKKLPRRLIALAKADSETLVVRQGGKGLKTLPNALQFLSVRERVTVESPTSSAPGADAFRWFFLAGNPPWSSKRHSLGNVRTIQKEFPLKLRNVYSFFTIYANIDGFDPVAMKGRSVAERALPRSLDPLRVGDS